MNKKDILIWTGVFTFLSIIFILFDWDRLLRLHLNSVESLTEIYKLKPKPPKRVVGVLTLKENEKPDNLTIKSLLDQNYRLYDIAIQTPSSSINSTTCPDLKNIATFHKPQTEWLRETEKDTVVIHLQNGKNYPYGFIDDVLHE